MHKIGINVNANVIYGVEPFLRCVAATGFDSVFTNSEEPAFVQWIRARCSALGLQYEALHAPFDNINEIWFSGNDAQRVVDRICGAIDLAQQNQVPIVVIHLSSGEHCPHVTDAGLKNIDVLVQFAKERGVTLAIENQRKLGNISTVLEIYGKDSNVGFCWDVGHEACFAHGKEYMPLFSDRCVLTHIHDNNCLYNIDEHLIPFDGLIDFRHTADVIHNANYQGTLMLELDLPHEGSDKYRALNLEQFVSKAYAAINRLRIIAE